MKKYLFILALLLAPSIAHPANWYVRPNGGAYGAENGSDWSNAFDGFTDIAWASVSCGDTIWVAGGTYTQSLDPAKDCTSGSQLYIRRARSDASACTSATGWSAGFDSTVTQNDAGIGFWGDYNYITVSGRTTAAGGSLGWLIDFTGTTTGNGVAFGNDTYPDYNTIEYMQITGPGSIDYTDQGRGLDITPIGGLATGNTFSHIKIHGWETGIYLTDSASTTFEYLEMYDINANNAGTWHPNGLITIRSDDVIVRYSKFYKNTYAIGEGIFFEQTGGCSNWTIYGNLFYNLVGAANYKAIEVTADVPGLLIYNNTFFNSQNIVYFSDAGACGTGSAAKNNLLINGGWTNSCGTMSNNIDASTPPDPFVDSGGSDFHIVSTIGAGYPRNAGTDLSGVFTTDLDGVTFGGDGTWDIGAYEYAASTPSAPTLLTPIDNTATGWPIVFDWDDYADATRYQIQVDDNSDYNSPEIDEVIDCDGPCSSADSTYTVNHGGVLNTNTHYYWRVRALH